MAKAQTNEVTPSIFPSLRFRRLNARRQEMPDPTPMAPPIGYKKQESMSELVRKMVRSALQEHAAQTGHESFEEADDFDIDDDPMDPQSAYEADFEGDAAAALRDPDPLQRTYGSVDEFLRANPAIASRITPAATPERGQGAQPTGGGAVGGLDASQVAPPSNPPAEPSAGHGNHLLGFLRRG